MKNRVYAPLLCDGPTAPEGDEVKPVWIQIARSGEWRGHATGEFSLDADAFEQMVRNFRANPAFEAGADGVGSKPVIPFDFQHASEDAPAAIAVNGAPAQGWALDLQVKAGKDGAVELWALADLLEPMRSYRKERRYRWTSIAAWPDAVDPVSGQKVGWYLSSIAFTNDPFIQGMTPLAATRVLNVPEFWLSSGRSLDELSNMLGAAVKAIYPPTEDYEYQPYVCDVFEQTVVWRYLGKYYEAAYALAGSQVTLQPAAEVVRTYQPLAAGRAEGEPLVGSRDRTGVDPTSRGAIESRMSDSKILAELANASEAKAALQTLLELLDSGDELAAAQEKISAYKKAMGDLQALLPGLLSSTEEEMASEDAAAMQDVEQAMSAHRLPAFVKSALLAERTAGVALVKLENGSGVEAVNSARERLQKRRAAREAFAKTYAVPAAPPTPPAPTAAELELTKPLVTPPAQPDPFDKISVRADGSMRRLQPQPPQRPAPLGDAGELAKVVSEIRMTSGCNMIQRCINMFRAKSGAAFSLEDAHERSCLIVNQARHSGLIRSDEV